MQGIRLTLVYLEIHCFKTVNVKVNTCKLILMNYVYGHHQCWWTVPFVNSDIFFTSSLQYIVGSGTPFPVHGVGSGFSDLDRLLYWSLRDHKIINNFVQYLFILKESILSTFKYQLAPMMPIAEFLQNYFLQILTFKFSVLKQRISH